MAVSLYSTSVSVFVKLLGNLSTILDQAAAHADAHKYETAVLLQSRLYPDMFALTKQVQLACDFAKGASARLAGVDIPKFEDTEATIEELKGRIAKTIAFIEGVNASDVEQGASRDIKLTMRDRTLELNGLDYFNKMAMPNFYFHLTVAYAILRHNGVPVGKRDFVGV